MSAKPTFQTTNLKYAQLNRANHVWHPHQSKGQGWWKCVLCGTVTNHPTANEPPDLRAGDMIEKLTPTERQLCPAPR